MAMPYIALYRLAYLATNLDMPRKHLIRTNQFPYHISARANNQDWFYLDKATCWDIFCHYLEEAQKKFKIEIHAFVMMSNHIHLIISTPHENIDRVMHYFMMMTSRAIGLKSGRTNRIWGSRYYWGLIDKPEYYAHAYKYIYANPLRAKIVKCVTQYPWSTFKDQSFKKFPNLLITKSSWHEIYFPKMKSELIKWINRQEDIYYTEQIRKALKKTRFEFNKNVHELLNQKSKLEKNNAYKNFKNYLFEARI